MPELPKAYLDFKRRHPAVVKAHEALGEACAGAGPLDARTREMVRLAVALGGRLEGAVRAHARRALEAGASTADIRHVVTLAAPTVGFPTAVAASTWLTDILAEGGRQRPRHARR